MAQSLLAESSAVWAIAAAVVALAAAAAVWAWIVRCRRDVWERFARRHGLRVDQHQTFPVVEGTVAGRPFRLEAASGGSDAEELGIVEVEMSLGLHGPLSAGLEIEDATGVIGEAQRSLEHDIVATGDAGFDHSVLVRSADPPAAVAFLDERRRRALQDLISRHPSANVGLSAGRISLREREMISRLEDLEARLADLCRAAAVLDARQPAGGEGGPC